MDICNTNMVPIPKTLKFSLLYERNIQWKFESWKIDQHAGKSCPPNLYRSFAEWDNDIILLQLKRDVGETLMPPVTNKSKIAISVMVKDT